MTGTPVRLDNKAVVISLGGTIAMSPGSNEGLVPTLSAQDLVAVLPAVPGRSVETISLMQKASSHLSFDDMELVARTIDDCFSQGAASVVVTQGTDTLEEMAFGLDLLVQSPRCFVITGAMRAPGQPSADGMANLSAALHVSEALSFSDPGALVVLNDEIHAARFVIKSHTSSLSAFVSTNIGKIGWITEGAPRLLSRLAKLPKIAPKAAAQPVAVPLVAMTLDYEPHILSAIVDAGPDGLVVSGFGGGHVNRNCLDILEQAARHIPVVLCSRTGGGKVLTSTYGYEGGEIDLRARGLSDSGWLDPLKARILTALALRHGQSREDLVKLLAFFR